MEANIKINPAAGGYKLRAERSGDQITLRLQGAHSSWRTKLTLTETRKLISGLKLMLPLDQRSLS